MPQEPLATLTILNNEIKPCKEGPFCMNGPSLAGTGALCRDCRLSPIYWGIAIQPTRHYWKPISHTYYHPVLQQEKRDAKRRKSIAKREAEKAKDPTKQARSRAAARAERKTDRAIIHATKNSGRSNKDGDHVLFGNITLDTKQQSQRDNPVVSLHELDKVRQDDKIRKYPWSITYTK
jgi:hypothetical protein